MFLGPYEKNWRDKNGIVNNSDIAIAKRLGLDRNTVCIYTTILSKLKEKAIQ